MTEINQDKNNNARKQVDDQTNGLKINQVNQEADKNVISNCKINEVKASSSSEQIRKSIQEEARKIISNFCSSSVDSDNKRSNYLSSDSSKTLENTQLLSSESSSGTDTENDTGEQIEEENQNSKKTPFFLCCHLCDVLFKLKKQYIHHVESKHKNVKYPWSV